MKSASQEAEGEESMVEQQEIGTIDVTFDQAGGSTPKASRSADSNGKKGW